MDYDEIVNRSFFIELEKVAKENKLIPLSEMKRVTLGSGIRGAGRASFDANSIRGNLGRVMMGGLKGATIGGASGAGLGFLAKKIIQSRNIKNPYFKLFAPLLPVILGGSGAIAGTDIGFHIADEVERRKKGVGMDLLSILPKYYATDSAIKKYKLKEKK